MDLNEIILNSIMQSNNCDKETAEKINRRAILEGSGLSDSAMSEFDDCLPTEKEWDNILSGIDNSDLD